MNIDIDSATVQILNVSLSAIFSSKREKEMSDLKGKTGSERKT